MIQTNGSDNSFSVSACCLRYDIRAYDIFRPLLYDLCHSFFLKELFLCTILNYKIHLRGGDVGYLK